jgi:hypothetical protein
MRVVVSFPRGTTPVPATAQVTLLPIALNAGDQPPVAKPITLHPGETAEIEVTGAVTWAIEA